MSSTSATSSHTRRNSKAEDLENPQLEEIINLDKDEIEDNQEIEEGAQETAKTNSAERADEPAIMLGEIVWKNLLQEEDELEGTDFMDQLEKELGQDDYKKVRRDTKKALLNRNENFHKTEFESVKTAKSGLMTLVIEIMMDEAGFVIGEVLKECRKQTDILELERNLLNQYQYN